ncbi:MAG TPA: TRAP transporter small permease [Paucimonas sp.]|nr:TRAP transporter small permease [Paucimonas sp.]
MRRTLDWLYDAAGFAAAFFMIGTFVMVMAGIADRVFALSLRGTDMYAGYCMAAAGFLALAHTLKRGEHIRVMLVLQTLPPRQRHLLELGSLFAASALAGALAWYSVRLAYQSWDFNDVSTGSDAMPLWIPQLAMAAGSIVFFIAFVDELVLELQGKRAQKAAEEALHNE